MPAPSENGPGPYPRAREHAVGGGTRQRNGIRSAGGRVSRPTCARARSLAPQGAVRARRRSTPAARRAPRGALLSRPRGRGRNDGSGAAGSSQWGVHSPGRAGNPDFRQCRPRKCREPVIGYPLKEIAVGLALHTAHVLDRLVVGGKFRRAQARASRPSLCRSCLGSPMAQAGARGASARTTARASDLRTVRSTHARRVREAPGRRGRDRPHQARQHGDHPIVGHDGVYAGCRCLSSVAATP